MSITYRPPFDEDDERDLRALYRKPGTGNSPELDAAVRRTWHPGHSWHPGWAAAACAAMVAGLFAWTDMRESVDVPDQRAQLMAPHDAGASAERSAPVLTLADTRGESRSDSRADSRTETRADARPDPRLESRTDAMASKPAAAVTTQRVAATSNDAAANQAQAPVQAAAPEAATAGAAQPAEAAATEVVAFSEEDIEARVAHIRSLMQNDQQDDAVQALRELQQGAPDLTLPDDLQELAQQNPA